MEEFCDRDGEGQHEAFKRWREENSDGYVLNCLTAMSFRLHGANCPHWEFDPMTEVSLTKKRKICSLDKGELERWATKRGTVAMCRDCF